MNFPIAGVTSALALFILHNLFRNINADTASNLYVERGLFLFYTNNV